MATPPCREGGIVSAPVTKAELVASDPDGRYPATVPLASRAIDERDIALNHLAVTQAKLDRALRRAEVAERQIRAATGARYGRRGFIRAEVRAVERATQHLFDLAEDGGATPDQLVAVAQVIGRLEDHAEAWRRASALSWRAADALLRRESASEVAS